MRINVLILTLGWLAFTLGLIITIMVFFYDLTADGAGYRGVFLISMGIVILAVQTEEIESLEIGSKPDHLKELKRSLPPSPI